MSNRTSDQISTAAEWKMGYEAQIEALTKPGLSDEQRVRKFAAAVQFTHQELVAAQIIIQHNKSLQYALWCCGSVERSLFANLPGCGCPVRERLINNRFVADGIPTTVGRTWTRAILENFMNVQMRERGLT